MIIKRKYWVISPNVKDDGDVDYWLKRINKEKKVFVNYELDTKHGSTFHESIQIDDIVIIAQGSSDSRKVYFAGKVSSTAQSNDLDGAQFRSLDFFCNTKELSDFGIMLDSTNAYGQSRNPGTIYQLHNSTNSDLIVINKIKDLMEIKNKNEIMKKYIDLLNYKKQIILQGPPGTGKTRMAKMMAEEMTKAEKILAPFEYIEYFIKNYKDSSQSNKYNEFVTEKLSEFTEEFPKDSIINLSLDQYCLGKGSTNSFCYWIEKGLKEVGRFSTGPAGTTVYDVYYSKDDNNYISVIQDKNPDEAIVIIREALSDLILNENYIKARKLFRFSFILKILNSYYPDNYFPIVSQKHLITVGRIFGLDSTGLNDIEINKKIKDKFIELKTLHSSKISSYNLMGHLYEKFKIKENQAGNISLNAITEVGETQLIQFHPAYSYEDFVRGIVVETNKENQIEYRVVNRTIAAFAEKALKDQNGKYVLIIDEINRANLPSVLGELIYALEYRYDEKLKNEKDATVESIYALKENEDDIIGNKTLMLPTNLYIIGTMNTADRSVGHIDYAIKRRFAFVDVLPEIEPVHPLIKQEFIKISGLFIKDFDGSNIPMVIEKSESLSDDFRPEDVWIGHSYFICKKENSNENEDETIAKPILNVKLKYEIIPLLKEYIKDGILNETEYVKKVMDELISKDFTK